MKTKKLLSIDPGWNGAIAVFEYHRNHIYLQSTSNCPSSRDENDLAEVFKECMGDSVSTTRNEIDISSESTPKVVIERVWSRPYERGAFAFGKNYGMWLGIAASFGCEIIRVLPREWQLTIGGGKESIPKDYQERKRYFKTLAQNWAGNKHKITLTNADAVCIGIHTVQEVLFNE